MSFLADVGTGGGIGHGVLEDKEQGLVVGQLDALVDALLVDRVAGGLGRGGGGRGGLVLGG